MDIWAISIFWLLWLLQLWMHAHIYLFEYLFQFFGYIPRHAIAGLHGNSMFNFLGTTRLYFPVTELFYILNEQYIKVSISHILINACYVPFL